MQDALFTLAPLLLFMMLPIWIPLVTVVVGAVADAGRRKRAR
ncbi:MAG TPA: hypothetical protein VNS55_09875 [Nocardioides sp.]|nr:hypothetical protein [Nocardioides sp.]